MSRAELIYPLRRHIERELSKVASDPFNCEILTRYYKVRCGKVELASQLAELIRLNIMSKMLGKRFEDATKEDIEELYFKINQKHSKPNTINKYLKILKAFFRWLKGYPKGDYPPEVKWIELKKVPVITVTAKDLLPFDECVRISEQALNLRDKALFQCKLDAGCRIGEILTVRIEETIFNDAGAILHAEGKTGPQPIILTWSAKILAVWLNNHPFKNDKSAPVFPVLGSAKPIQLSYAAARKAFADCVRRAGYTDRRVWLHLLKHVSSTEDAAKGLPQSFRNYKHHWTPDSPMAKIYEHLSQSVIPEIQSETWKRIVGTNIHTEGSKQDKPLQLLRQCRRCQFENPRDSAFCNRCGFSFDEKKAAESAMVKTKVDALLNALTENPETLDKLLALVKS